MPAKGKTPAKSKTPELQGHLQHLGIKTKVPESSFVKILFQRKICMSIMVTEKYIF
jgi:hypothetical protein